MYRPFTIALTFLAGAFFILEFVLPEKLPAWAGGTNPLTPYLALATDLVIILSTMAFLLGPINLVRAHAATLWQRRQGWGASLVFLVFLFGSIAVASANACRPGNPALTRAYNALFYGIIFAFGTSSFGLLAFYLVSAAYRAFRLNSLDAAVMMVAAVIVLLGRGPVGDWLSQGWPRPLQLHALENWLMNTPNAAVQRAVALGAFAGAFAAALRYWLSLGRRME